MKYLCLALLLVVVGCTNLADGKEYRVLTDWPILCAKDGSILLLQKANSDGNFTDANETHLDCIPASKINLTNSVQ